MKDFVNDLSIFDFIKSDENCELKEFVTIPFFQNGKEIKDEKAPKCYLTLKAASSMRFRLNEKNLNRENFFSNVVGEKQVVPLELIHSQVVYAVKKNSLEELEVIQSIGIHPDAVVLKKADGLISVEENIVPVVTVADCVPIFLFDPVTKCKGILHSGWKGTGIVVNAIKLASMCYGAKAENFSVVIGPHIHECCYTIDEERALYFDKLIGKGCATSQNQKGVYNLSLARANIHLLKQIGVLEKNIIHCSDCTVCTQPPIFGSFRRETSFLPKEMSLNEKIKKFTAMAAFVM